MVELRFFGAGQMCFEDRMVAGFPAHNPCLLFCYLVLNRHGAIPRERLAAVFWGDYPIDVARKNLRNTLWRLRLSFESVGGNLEQYLTVDDDSICFRKASGYWLDTEIFEDAVARLRDTRGRHLVQKEADQLQEATKLYIGDLLESVYEDWCLHDREHLRLMYLGVLGKLISFHTADGSYEQGLAYGEMMLKHDPLRERVHRSMMRLYWLIGDRSAALAQYHLCSQILRDELGAEPMQQSTNLYEQMLHDHFDLAGWLEKRIRVREKNGGGDLNAGELAQRTLPKLHQLQHMVERTGEELEQLELLIRCTLDS